MLIVAESMIMMFAENVDWNSRGWLQKCFIIFEAFTRSGDTSVSSGMMTFLLQAQQRPEKNGYVAQTFIEANG